MKKKIIFRPAFVLLTMGLSWVTTLAQLGPQSRFELKDVHLLESPFLKAEEADLQYMLKLDPDRLLAPYLREAGLPARAKSYGNWESMGLDGHTAGHYLTALAQMYESSGNRDCKNRLDYMVSELARCQQASSDGYVGGIPGSKQMWGRVKKGDLSLFKKKWVPWYNLHKLFAGLRDAYLIAGNMTAKKVLIKLTDWAYQELDALSTQQIKAMLDIEYGGMNEVCADVAEITGDHKYLSLARKFSQPEFVKELSNQKDKLTGKHANTQIPKVIGFERIAELDPIGGQKYKKAATFFWNTVVKNRSLSFGGNSVNEHFNPSNDFSKLVETVEGPETCNSYNMLRLTEMLFLQQPSATYMDYYERTIYNHILSSERLDKGGFVYFTPIRPASYKVYSVPENDFWCCVGTGMENHGKYGEMIYTHKGPDLFVNLFIPSTLNWESEGLQLTQENHFPFEESSSLTLNLKTPKKFTLFIRKPGWLKSQMTIRVNGEIEKNLQLQSGYLGISRNWKDGDRVQLSLPMKNQSIAMPDHSAWVSFMHGPIVLAAATDTSNIIKPEGDGGRFDHVASGPLYELAAAPIVREEDTANLDKVLKPVKNKPLHYLVDGLKDPISAKPIELEPFYLVQNTRSVVYFPVAAADSITKMRRELSAEDRKLIERSRSTVDYIATGEQQPEVEHLLKEENSMSGYANNRHYRQAANGYFSYKMKMNANAKNIEFTYYGEDKSDAFTILVNGNKIANEALKGGKGKLFFRKKYHLPEALKSENLIEVKVKVDKDGTTARVFGIRVVK